MTTTDSRTTAPKRSPRTRPRQGASAFDARPWWQPTRDELVDGGVAVLLALVATYGLTTVYDGNGVMIVGLVGALVGVIAAWIVGARGLSPLVGLGVVTAAAIVGSGVAVPDQAVAGVLPGPDTPAAFLRGLVHSWRDLVTTAPPVGLGGGLGAVPYVIGFVSGCGGMLLARLTGAPLLPAAPPLAAVVASIVFGDVTPASVAVQGAGFLVVALAWGAARSNRELGASTDGIYWPRVLGSAAMLAVLVLVGMLAGPRLPFVDDDDRLVLRREVVPPFDAADYGSPLATLRSYRTDAEDKARTYLRAEGLPEGALVRIATMDTYDGVVWTVSGTDQTGSGRFKRVGAQILPVPPGERAVVDFTVEGYTGVWVPTLGTLRSAGFDGPDADSLERQFRYNPTTGTAASTFGLQEGNRYRVEVVLPAPRDDEALASAQLASPFAAYPAEVGETLDQLTQPVEGELPVAASPFQRALALEELFQSWYFSDGGREVTGPGDVAAGHSVARLNDLMERRVGNAEQYAAAMAVVANRMGMPARVVMGFAPEGSGTVELTGADATAWVEIQFQGHGWVPFHPTPDEDQEPKPNPRALEEVEREQQPIPETNYLEPPPPNPPIAEESQDEEEDEEEVVADRAGLPPFLITAATYGGPPLVLIGGTLGGILGVKALRRRRRQNRGTPVERLNGAWLETVDRLRDQGYRPRPGITRRELAGEAGHVLAWSSGAGFAESLDRSMFGPDEPDDQAVRSAWAEHDEQVRSLREPLTRRQRLRARLSLASLRPSRPAGRRVTTAGEI